MSGLPTRADARSRAPRTVWPVVAAILLCTASLLFVYRTQILSGGRWLPGDVLDARIALAIEQHWSNVFHGLEGWNQPIYFAPTPDALGYNDGYFLFGVFSSGFRLLGLDIFLAGEASAAVFRIVGFASLFVLGWRFLLLPYPAALLAAVLATVSDAMYLQSAHVQLLSVGLAPLLAILLCQAALHRDHAWRFAAWCCAAAVLFDAWLMTAFYTAWFTALFAVLSILAAGPARVLATARGLPRTGLACACATLAAGAVPFALVYAPKARETGMHAFWEMLELSPSVLDLVHVGPGNLMFGWLDRWLTAALRPGFPTLGEHTIGWPPPLLALGLAGAVLAIARRSPWRPFAIAFLAALVLGLHVGRFSPWWLVYKVVPGAGAVRVVARFTLFLYPIAALFAAACLAGAARRGWRGPAVAVALLLVTEEATTDGAFLLDRTTEVALVAGLPPPPADCASFYVQVPRTVQAEFDALLVNVDGMFLAETLHLPTPNGLASFLPAGFDFSFDTRPRYDARVRQALLSDELPGICGLDLPQRAWTRPAAEVAAVPLGQDIRFGAEGDGGGVLLRGWSGQEPAGRWSVGTDARMAMRIDPPVGRLALTLNASAFAGRGGPGPIVLSANGTPVAQWQPSSPLQALTATIPAGLIAPDGVLRLHLAIARPMRPKDAGQGTDGRWLGLFIESLRLTAAPTRPEESGMNHPQ